MIAVHTALYIFRPKSSYGEGGLYPYRHYAYTLWVVVPLVMASLAFINNSSSYVPEGTYCYLPVRPLWYRLALAWIPRYIIFIFILGMYASIYYYVRYRFQDFNREGETQGSGFDTTGTVIQTPQRVKRNTLPAVPSLTSHLVQTEERKSSMPVVSMRRKSIIKLQAADMGRRKSNSGAHRFMLASFTAGEGSFPTPPSEPSLMNVGSFIGPTTSCPIAPISPMSHSPPNEALLVPEAPSHPQTSSWRGSFVKKISPSRSGSANKKPSAIGMVTIPRQYPVSPVMATPTSQLQLVNSRGETYADAEMLRARDKIQRQLRFLFIYPLVYIGTWILPFVSHVLQYDDRYALNPPFALTCVTTVSICIQAAVDCWLFSTREKPWRHIPGSNGDFWVSLKFWSGWKGIAKRKMVNGPGKTREEMVREARAAYKRRDQELAQRKEQAEQSHAHTPTEAVKREERSWWDGTGIGGVVDSSMSPVAEEVSNPMENIHVLSSDEEKGLKMSGEEHEENIFVGENQQIEWESSEPVSPISGEGSSSST
jgi:G protein-coupled receptor GPR1